MYIRVFKFEISLDPKPLSRVINVDHRFEESAKAMTQTRNNDAIRRAPRLELAGFDETTHAGIHLQQSAGRGQGYISKHAFTRSRTASFAFALHTKSM